MRTAAQQALAVPDIITNILEHFYKAHLDQSEPNYLLSAALVTQTWTRPAQELLHWRLSFHRGTTQLKQWLASTGQEQVSKYRTWELEMADFEQLQNGDGWDLDIVKQVLTKVKGVASLSIELRSELEIQTDWIVGQNFQNLKHLALGTPLSASTKIPAFSLASIVLHDRDPRIPRDWGSTCKILTRQRKDREHNVLALSFLGIEGYNRYLVPELPLPKDPLSITGNFLNIADSLLFLAIPSLLPVPALPNLAIFGAACRSLKVLSITSITPYSAFSIPILQFFPTVVTLRIDELIGLPNGHNLHVAQLRRFINARQGNVIPALALHMFSKEGINLRTIEVSRYKYMSFDQRQLFYHALIAKGGGGAIAFIDEVELTLEEKQLVNRLDAETKALNAEEERSKRVGKIAAQITELDTSEEKGGQVSQVEIESVE